MTRYGVYLEQADDGTTMAHVLELPGCTVRASSREEALQRVPDAIRAYEAWLRRHGEPAPSEEEPIELAVAGEASGMGPFAPGDAAALFPPDRRPIPLEEMAQAFRLMAHSRSDLLALVQDLPDDLLDWRPYPESHTIRRLLRHIGNAEEWYVSRLVPPETLPAEWEDDEALPLFDFLEMERRTAVARLHRLSPSERAEVVFPRQWTDHPEEAWSARKALRRFLEHEREHTDQVRQILDLRRRHLLARLAAERSELLAQLLGLDEHALTETPILQDWTVHDLLAHIAGWDRWEYGTMQALLAGRTPELRALDDLAGFNAAAVAAWHDRSLADLLTQLSDARAVWVTWLEQVPLAEFFRPRPLGDWDWAFPNCLEIQWQHDAEHAVQIAAWVENRGGGRESGPREVLSHALAAARAELLAAAAVVPAEQCDMAVCGEWTLLDLLGHVADWEEVGAAGLRLMGAGRPPTVGNIPDIESWNQAHARARRGQPAEAIRQDLHHWHHEMMEILDTMNPSLLYQPFEAPWGGRSTAYDWVCVYHEHDREHARDIRQTVIGAARVEPSNPGKTWTRRGG